MPRRVRRNRLHPAFSIICGLNMMAGSVPALAASGDALKLMPAPAVSPQDIAWDPESKHYFLTTFINGRILRLSENLAEVVDEIPSPFDNGEIVTGIAFDTTDRTLWVVQPQIREIAEITLAGSLTGRRIAPPLLPVPNPGSDPSPRGLAFNPGGDGGLGSLYLVESVGTIIYELDFQGGIIRQFVHPDDPDGFPGLGASAGCSDIDVIIDRNGELTGFWVNGYDRDTRTSMLRKLNVAGEYTGISIPLINAGGNISGILAKDYRNLDAGEIFNPAVIAVVESKAEFAILDGAEPPLREISGFACQEAGSRVVLTWTPLDAYDRIEVLRDDLLVKTLPGNASTYAEEDLPEAVLVYRLRAVKGVLSSSTGECITVIGPGQASRSGGFDGRLAVDLALDSRNNILVADYYERSLRIHTINPDGIHPFNEMLTPLEEEEDRLTGVAYRPESDSVFLYNSETNVIVEMENKDHGLLLSSAAVSLPNDPADPADKALVIGMDFSPEGNGGRGSLWFIEAARSLIYEVDLQGAILRSFPHPDLLKVQVPKDSLLSPYVSALAVVPGTGGNLLALSGGTVFDRDSVRILYFDAGLEREIAGEIIPLDGVDKIAPHSYLCMAFGEAGGKRVLYITTIVQGNSRLVEIDASQHALRPLTDLQCHQDGFQDAVQLTFSNNDRYDRIEVLRDGLLLADLPGGAAAYRDSLVAGGNYRYDVRAWQGTRFTTMLRCSLQVGPGALLERRFLEAPSPVQLAPDPEDGTFLMSSNAFQQARNLQRLDADFQTIEVLQDMVNAPFQVATLAIRRPPAPANRQIYVLAWQIPGTIGGGQDFEMLVYDISGARPALKSFPVHPPVPDNGFIIYPVGLTWHPPTDTFFYLERNSATFVQLDPDGQVRREFHHPAPPKQSFVFNLGLAADPQSGALFASTAGPEDQKITRVVQLTPNGNLTGIIIPVGHLVINPITGIALRPSAFGGDELVAVGSQGGASESQQVEVFDPIPAPRDLSCRIAESSVTLSWKNSAPYQSVSLLRDGVELGPLPGSAESFTDADLAWIGVRVYSVRGSMAGGSGRNAFCEVSQSQVDGRFIRGNVDGSEQVDITDAIVLLSYLFLGGSHLTCEDAADADDSGLVDITDAIRILLSLFLGETPPPPPYPAPGEDPTPDALTCG